MLNRTAHVFATPLSAFGGGGQAWATPFGSADAGARPQGLGA
ncbi:hypothetical protein [Aquabacterium sp. NJ1]|nr:hypothetical protein [Aquabacterium sp. NJ1]